MLRREVAFPSLVSRRAGAHAPLTYLCLADACRFAEGRRGGGGAQGAAGGGAERRGNAAGADRGAAGAAAGRAGPRDTAGRRRVPLRHRALLHRVHKCKSDQHGLCGPAREYAMARSKASRSRFGVASGFELAASISMSCQPYRILSVLLPLRMPFRLRHPGRCLVPPTFRIPCVRAQQLRCPAQSWSSRTRSAGDGWTRCGARQTCTAAASASPSSSGQVLPIPTHQKPCRSWMAGAS